MAQRLLISGAAILIGLASTGTALAGQTAARDHSDVTFTKDIAPILQRSCQTCHRPDSVAPMSLLTYQQARPWARTMKMRTSLGPGWSSRRSMTSTRPRALRPGAQEGTPLAYGGTLYVPNPNEQVQAIDAVTGDLKWEYRRDIPDDALEVMGGLTENNRNIAIYGNLIIDTANDDYVYALDATTGELAW